MGSRGAAAPHATPAESAGATERLLRPPGRVIIGPLDGAAEHGPRRRMDQDDDPRREAALWDARRAAAGRRAAPSRTSRWAKTGDGIRAGLTTVLARPKNSDCASAHLMAPTKKQADAPHLTAYEMASTPEVEYLYFALLLCWQA